jgi:4-hydroxy-3-methylbut-2-enyl diphosphate reductase
LEQEGLMSSEKSPAREIVLAQPRGFCAGVERAIETVRLSLKRYGAPVYVLHEIVHNRHVLEELQQLGAIFVEDLSDIPSGGICIFSAHGVARLVELRAGLLGLKTIDATCPLVGSVHRMVEKYHAEGYDVLIIGHHNHPEVEGTAGRVDSGVHIIASVEEAGQCQVADPQKVAYVTQTTLSVDDTRGIIAALERRYRDLVGPEIRDICYATQNRQDAVKLLAPKVDVVIVVGSPTSSNSNRLRELAERLGADAYMVESAVDLRAEWLAGKRRVGVTAGASAPEILVQQVVERLRALGAVSVRSLPGAVETVHFPLPKGLGDKSMGAPRGE